MKRFIKNTVFAVAFPLAGMLTGSCTDSWNDHYDTAGQGGSGQSLLQCIEENPLLSNFLKVCQVTHLYNNMHVTPVTYAELLNADQSLTVWAPVNDTFNVDSLLRLCETAQGDSTVALHFVANHISRSLYNMNSSTAETVKMLNDKFLNLTPQQLLNSKVVEGSYNIPATNGLLHVIGDDAPYSYNLYEGLTSLSQYAHIGKLLKRMEKKELDEERSIQSGLIDGRKVYSDSVMVTENDYFRSIGDIISEDSTYMMLVPNANVWNTLYNEATSLFNYGNVEKADSIGEYWKTVSLVQDLIFNCNRAVNKAPQDSLITSSYTYEDWPYHVYYKPYETDSLFDRAQIVDSMKCSNGVFYDIAAWPFETEKLYFHPVKTEGEREANMINYTLCTTNVRETNNPAISGGGYLDIVPKSSTSNWTATFEVRNTLSGTYDICIITLPKTVYMANSKDKKPNKFKAQLTYTDIDGEKKSVNYDTELKTSGTAIDTMLIGRFTFPVCHYAQPEAGVTLQIQCSITNRQTQFSREMYLDCIYLKPVEEMDEAKARKEARK
ncbi:MAG: fasciclin domain-containing protein [Bacteroidaceae bacterium]|nr:fasciclin domain-containing protein [Bacteroidaceae bacterium]